MINKPYFNNIYKQGTISLDPMGRIKTKAAKRITEELVDNHFDDFTEDFDQNKAIVEKHAEISSKKLRNIITGYVTRRVKSRETLWGGMKWQTKIIVSL